MTQKLAEVMARGSTAVVLVRRVTLSAFMTDPMKTDKADNNTN